MGLEKNDRGKLTPGIREYYNIYKEVIVQPSVCGKQFHGRTVMRIILGEVCLKPV